jgi:hypothetical protein
MARARGICAKPDRRAVIAYFKFETQVTQDGFVARVWKPPYRGSLIKDDVWFFVPVSHPLRGFCTESGVSRSHRPLCGSFL